jgi:uncharacterized protein YutE (UPF0331/DUF86 family)
MIYSIKGMIIVYFVDRGRIEAILIHMSKILDEFKKENFEGASSIKTLALERTTHIVIESILDVGNAMIDGFIMRDPGSYEDIIDILEDEKVVQHEEAKGLKELILLRKMLVQEYTEINHEKVLACMNKNLSFISRFPIAITNYLENGLGPVSAFKPHE